MQRFPFVNKGKQAVSIDSVKASCGCLTPSYPKRPIEPGETGFIDVEVNTLSQPAGANLWKATLTCGSVESTLLIQAKLIAELGIEPASLQIISDKPISQVVTLTDYRPQPLEVKTVQTSSSELHAELLPPRRDAQGRLVHAVQVQVAANFPDGRHDEVVSLYTSDPAYRELRVPVAIVKRSRQRVSVSPERVSIPVTSGQGTPSQIVLIRDADDQRVEVGQIVAEHAAVQCRWVSAPNGSMTLRIQVDGTQVGSQSFKTEVEVHVTKPIPQVLRIPVACEVTPGL